MGFAAWLYFEVGIRCRNKPTRSVALPRASLDVKRGAHTGLEFVRKVLCAKVRGRPGTHFCARHLLYINESAKCTTSFVHARARTKLVVHFADAFLYNKCRAQKCATFVVHFADAFLYNKCRAQKEPLANICMSVDSQVCFFNTKAFGNAYNIVFIYLHYPVRSHRLCKRTSSK